jgi:hypothetical protein
MNFLLDRVFAQKMKFLVQMSLANKPYHLGLGVIFEWGVFVGLRGGWIRLRKCLQKSFKEGKIRF